MKEIILDLKKVNLISVLFSVLILTFQILFYQQITSQSNVTLNLKTIGIITLAFIGGIILHELIHGICFAQYAKKGFKAIKFGIIWKHFVIYCHCDEPLNVNPYRLSLIMPAVILGIIPSLIAYITHSFPLLFWSCLMLIGALGDFICLWMMRSFNNSIEIMDHPNKIGFYYRVRENH